MKNNKINAMIVSMAKGDSLGFPFENMNKKLLKKISPELNKNIKINGNIFLDDMITDDTEHLVLTYLSLRKCEDIKDVMLWRDNFEETMRKNILSWFYTLPAGIGKATLISCFKMSLLRKKTPESGYYSGGNGPLMRVPIIGAFYANDETKRRDAVKISTLMTHTHPFALISANILSEICSTLYNEKITNFSHDFLPFVINLIELEKNNYISENSLSEEDLKVFSQFQNAIKEMKTINKTSFLDKNFPFSASGFCLNTLKICIAMLHYNETEAELLKDTIFLGGDTDTNAGIANSVFSLKLNKKELEPVHILKKVDSPFFFRIITSLVGWMKSFYSLYRFIYYFKKIRSRLKKNYILKKNRKTL